MPHSDPAAILLTHDRWATANLINACAQLPNDRFHQSFDMGVGSLHDTIRHILGAMRGWTDMLNGQYRPGGSPRPRLEEEGPFSCAQFAELHTSIADEFETAARAGSPEDAISGDRGGRSFTFTRGAILTHVTSHAMHHRAQCLNMLRRLGADQLPPSSVMEWTLIADA